jgi:ParB family chromosome partitioning protein
VNVKDDIEANAITAITNKQREKLTVMEQAYIYRYEYDLIKSQGREKENGKWSVDEIAENESSSGRTIQRLIKLTYLIEDLQQMINAGSLSKKAGHELAALKINEQKLIQGLLTEKDIKISTKQAAEIKKQSKEGLLTRDVAMSILSEGKEKSDENTGSRKISISIPKEYGEFFPPACSTKEKREKVMIWLLKNYQNEIYERFGEDYE